jgi:hypothetical protein
VNSSATWFRRILRLTVIVDFIVGLFAIIFPNTMLRLFAQQPSNDVLWTAYGGLMLLVFALLVRPAGHDPVRYHDTAVYAVVARALMAVFFLLVWPGRYVWLGVVDLVVFLILATLLYLAARQPQAEWVMPPAEAVAHD